jgi:hypothetical protein
LALNPVASPRELKSSDRDASSLAATSTTLNPPPTPKAPTATQNHPSSDLDGVTSAPPSQPAPAPAVTSGNAHRWLSMFLVACLVAGATAAACLLVQTGHVSSPRLLPSLHCAARAAWYAARVVGMAVTMLHRVAADATVECINSFASSDTSYRLHSLAESTSAALTSLASVLASSAGAVPSIAVACGQRGQTVLAALPAFVSAQTERVQLWAASAVVRVRATANAAAPRVAALGRKGVAACQALWPFLQQTASSCIAGAHTGALPSYSNDVKMALQSIGSLPVRSFSLGKTLDCFVIPHS